MQNGTKNPGIQNITHGGPTMSLNPCWVFYFNITGLFQIWGIFGLFSFGKDNRVAHQREDLPAWLSCAVTTLQPSINQWTRPSTSSTPLSWETLCIYMKSGLEKTKKLGNEQWEVVFPQDQALLWIQETGQVLSPGQAERETVYAQTLINSSNIYMLSLAIIYILSHLITFKLQNVMF